MKAGPTRQRRSIELFFNNFYIVRYIVRSRCVYIAKSERVARVIEPEYNPRQHHATGIYIHTYIHRRQLAAILPRALALVTDRNNRALVTLRENNNRAELTERRNLRLNLRPSII